MIEMTKMKQHTLPTPTAASMTGSLSRPAKAELINRQRNPVTFEATAGNATFSQIFRRELVLGCY